MDNDKKGIECSQSLFGIPKNIHSALFWLVIVLVAFFIMKTATQMLEFQYVGSDVTPQTTISVSGKGEFVVVPDIATFTYAVRKEAKTVADAQSQATEISNSALTYLKGQGIKERDIKTIAYNINPRYEYRQQICTATYCPPSGERQLVGYEVSQTVSVKVRDTQKVGTLLGGLGETGVTDISGLTFSVDDEEGAKREARKEAIDNAQEKAKMLAHDLGVDLVRIVSFSESGDYPIYRLDTVAYGLGGATKEAAAPEIPAGENTITSNVTIVYEIR